ncbi:MAG: Ig-like domain-containing protein, partial [Planctomycetota bacterium]|nr:Ig-like domain-containing protein [Planctomycetota bacterium]
VVEDFLPFDVNVTTEDPGVEALRKTSFQDERWGTRALNTQYTDGFGNGTGGIAHLNSFDASVDDPVFTFNKGANAGGMTNSHEVGHALGLRHDGLNDSAYHPGTGSGQTSWGPIMGAPFGKNLVQWSQGDYDGSTNSEDDLNIITSNRNGFGFRDDDHGDGLGSATPLEVTDDINVSSWGIIERNTDLDYFSFSSGAGDISIDIAALTVNSSLDVEAKLYDSNGQVMATSNPSGELGASFDLSVDGGTYFISIDGTGKPGVYSDYGSLGYYQISGVVQNAVNNPPTLDALEDWILEEDAAEQTVFLEGISAGENEENQPIRVTAISNDTTLIPHPTIDYVSPNPTGFLKFTPVPDRNGNATVTVTVEDGGLDLNLDTLEDNAQLTRTFVVVVNPLNDPPTLNPLSDLDIDEDAGEQVLNLTGISDGDEGEQPLSIVAISSNTTLIPNPIVDYTSPNATGQLKLTPSANQSGTSRIFVTVEDGGNDNDLATEDDNLSLTRTFFVTVNSVNDKPTLDALEDQMLLEDEPRSIPLSGITAGGDEIQPLAVTATSSNQTLMSNPQVDYASDNQTGTLHLVPKPEQTGLTTITVLVEDGGPDLDLLTPNDNAFFVRTFLVNVDADNDAPTLNPIEDIDLLEDAGEQKIGLTGISAGSNEVQPLEVTATSSNPDLIGDPIVDYTSPDSIGSLAIMPNDDRFGTTVITVTVEDGGLDQDLSTTEDNATLSQSFTVTVEPVNDAPRFNVPSEAYVDRSQDLTEIEITDIDPGPLEDQRMQFSVSTDNPGFITNLDVDYQDPSQAGAIRFDTQGQLGRGKIFVTAEDAGPDGKLSTQQDNATTTQIVEVMVTAKSVSFAHTDQTIHGLIEGTYGNTYWRSRTSQQITEVGYRQGERSRLDHRWKVDLPGPNESLEFIVFAGHNATNEQFRFQYAVDGSSTWKDLVTTTQKGTRKYYSRIVDPTLQEGGSVWVRVQDTNRGNDQELASLDIQKLFFLNRGINEIKHAVNGFVYDGVANEPVTQGNNKAQIRFQLADRMRLDQDMEVHYQVGGTASNGDYREILTGKKIIKAGNLMARLILTPKNDRLLEGNESLTVTILPHEDYRITGTPTTSVTIVDHPTRGLSSFEANAEVSYLGRHSVNYQQSQFDDGQKEVISERKYGNRSMMNHQWRFDVAGKTDLVFEGQFRIVDDPFVDTFQVSYSTDQEQWKPLGRLEYGNTGDINRQVNLDPGTTDVWVRLHDRYRQAHDTHIARVNVSQIRFVETEVVGPGMLIANQFESLSSAMPRFAQPVSENLDTSPQAFLVGHQDAVSNESSEDFVLPEFYTNPVDDELDSVFFEWGS